MTASEMLSRMSVALCSAARRCKPILRFLPLPILNGIARLGGGEKRFYPNSSEGIFEPCDFPTSLFPSLAASTIHDEACCPANDAHGFVITGTYQPVVFPALILMLPSEANPVLTNPLPTPQWSRVACSNKT